MKLLSWNVNGIRAVQKKGFQEWFCGHGADVVCLQETKAHKEQLDETVTNLTGYESFWCSGEKKGYSGVATYTRQKPQATKFGFGVPEFDREGRVLITAFPEFDLYNIYFPNGKRGQERLDYKLGFYEAILGHWQRERKQGKSLVICGDYNTAHHEIDLARPKDNQNISGFLRIERDWLDKLVALGYVDTFRMFSQQPGHYTWWDQLTRARERNTGWRIDYFFVTEELKSRVKSAWICPEVMGSDHCPVGLEICY